MRNVAKSLLKLYRLIWTFSFKFLNLNKKLLKIDTGAIFYKSKCKIKSTNQLILATKSLNINSSYVIRGTGNIVEIGKNTKIYNSSIVIKGNNNKVVIGQDVKLRNLQLIIEKDDNVFSVGNKSTTNGLVEVYLKEGKRVIIGQDCMLSREIIIRTSDGHSILNENNQRINFSSSVIISDRTWIGQRVMIMKGTVIPSNSIVAAGSIVTKEFKTTNVVLAGGPAKIVKKDIDWSRELL